MTVLHVISQRSINVYEKKINGTQTESNYFFFEEGREITYATRRRNAFFDLDF